MFARTHLKSTVRGASGGLLTLLLGLAAAPSWSAEAGRPIPAYVGTGEAAVSAPEIAVLAGGCFWGVQGVYEHVKGVIRAVSGYTGGSATTAQYETVSTGGTGHAESVQITFDPHRISYAQILQIFFSVVHNPTELNRQGPDVGTQYRSAVFPLSPEQARIAKQYIAQLNRARVFDAAIVTRIEQGKVFYPAEAYHQDYLVRNPDNPYIFYNDLPKIKDLMHLFPARYRPDPVLVLASDPGR
ncbi:MAG TPA: peptide-methionine (S)-S-oxide reductase MsrA [Steroidobacteraceae bacterium]|nr:peptide-methionine (S)-S-oxide reductase MsrA [Steroidobacteraceae bacterium]